MGVVKILTQPESFQFYRGKGYAYGPREVSLDAGTPDNNGIMGNGTSTNPLISTPLPPLDSSQTTQISTDSLHRLVTILTQPESFQFYRGKGYTYGPREVSLNAGTPNNEGIMGNGSTTKPLIITPLPTLDAEPTSKTSIDSLFRGTGLSERARNEDIKRIEKFLESPAGRQFILKEQTLLLKQNIEVYGKDILKYKTINPLSYIANVATSGTGVRVPNILNFGLNPSLTREALYGEIASYPNNRTRKIAQKAGLNVDTITTSPMYMAQSVKGEYLNDTVPFYIQKINNDGSGNNTYIHFRAYVTGLTDDYGADWSETKYMGRGEKFFSYHGFSRDISFGFSVPVLSRAEQSSVYSKLNYLASMMAPDYTEGGFMRGNLVKITIGDYIKDLPGILKGVSYEIDSEAGWDIARDELGNKEPDAYVMPKLIQVKGIKFVPIHNFIPQTVSSKFIGTINDINGKGNDVNSPFITFGRGKEANSTGGYKNTAAKGVSASDPA